ncbi:hypothetical protein CC1G_02753 [Coprinopsis cinerea okayama7|uniref:Uncharacterized protein n=1 Tax=Coprinopsis cinerea (strain Okayama-7 / 130 / ATCC MYA-4618 / FGSC 9003) TaxID=240176 RepID=A8MZU8_COPC7|nr:hypothetical protein CC1G_02753 [Coprinopsis cinerea okayama7\|eukprot:XP_001828172.2 hypothetical protein CC1G_02753 [Coprinopsis cinerea okayama7\
MSPRPVVGAWMGVVAAEPRSPRPGPFADVVLADRDVKDVAERLLYHSISISDRQDLQATPIETLATNYQKAAMVKKLRVVVAGSEDGVIISRLLEVMPLFGALVELDLELLSPPEDRESMVYSNYCKSDEIVKALVTAPFRLGALKMSDCLLLENLSDIQSLRDVEIVVIYSTGEEPPTDLQHEIVCKWVNPGILGCVLWGTSFGTYDLSRTRTQLPAIYLARDLDSLCGTVSSDSDGPVLLPCIYPTQQERLSLLRSVARDLEGIGYDYSLTGKVSIRDMTLWWDDMPPIQEMQELFEVLMECFPDLVRLCIAIDSYKPMILEEPVTEQLREASCVLAASNITKISLIVIHGVLAPIPLPWEEYVRNADRWKSVLPKLTAVHVHGGHNLDLDEQGQWFENDVMGEE